MKIFLLKKVSRTIVPSRLWRTSWNSAVENYPCQFPFVLLRTRFWTRKWINEELLLLSSLLRLYSSESLLCSCSSSCWTKHWFREPVCVEGHASVDTDVSQIATHLKGKFPFRSTKVFFWRFFLWRKLWPIFMASSLVSRLVTTGCLYITLVRVIKI